MKRRTGIALAGLIALVFATSPLAAETWYAQRVTQGRGGIGVEHLWSSGPSLRAEVVVNGHPVVTLVSGSRYSIIDILTGEGISIERHSNAVNADSERLRPFADEAPRLQRRGGEFIRDEPLGDNVRCKLYKLTDEHGRHEVCVQSDENALPVFIKHWDRTTKRESVTQYVNWAKGLEIPTTFFAADPRIKMTPYTYAAYVKATQEGKVGPAPVLFPHLLHGEREE